jgi:hypothetical protein
VGEGHTGGPQANHERLTVAQAAARLRITEGAVRSRIKRGTLPTVKEGGNAFVLLGGGASEAKQTTKTGVPVDQSALIEALRDQIEDLRRERDEWRGQARMTDRLLSAAIERIPPQLEAPQEARESPQTADEQQGRGHPTPLREGLRRVYRDRGGGECSEDERQGFWDVEAHAEANLWAPRPIRGGAWSGTQHRRGPFRKRMRWPSR